jgi:hypothetical protein
VIVARAWMAVVALSGCDGAFDLVRLPPYEAPPDAATTCLEDGFDDPVLDLARWISYGEGKNIFTSVVDGTLHIDVPAATTTDVDPYGGIRIGSRDLTGLTVEAELVQPGPPDEPSEAVLQLKMDAANHFDFFVQRKVLVVRTLLGGMQSSLDTPYDPALHRVLRIRHELETDEIVFEARGLDTDWVEITRKPRTFSLASADFLVFAGTFDIAPAFTAVFDNVRVTGPCTF